MSIALADMWGARKRDRKYVRSGVNVERIRMVGSVGRELIGADGDEGSRWSLVGFCEGIDCL